MDNDDNGKTVKRRDLLSLVGAMAGSADAREGWGLG